VKVIRGDIIADQIKFNVDAQTYRNERGGFTRLDAVHKMAAQLGFELEGVGSMQAIPIGEDRYEVRCRSAGAPDDRSQGLLSVRVPPIA
jgi:hypothetical protein